MNEIFREQKWTENREKSHLPFPRCEKLIRDQIKNLFSIERLGISWS